jgi:hypothetical protein
MWYSISIDRVIWCYPAKKQKQETRRRKMKQALDYTTLEFPELLALAMKGDRGAAAEIIRRHESLKIKANSKRKEKAEKTPVDLAKDNAYFRAALLVKQFGIESVNMQTLTAASAYLGCGLAQGNLRQAYNRVQQILKAQAVNESVFPDWIVEAAEEIPQLDENKKLEEEGDKVEQIKSIVQKYIDNEQLPPPLPIIVIPEAPASPAPAPEAPAATTPAKKGGKK